MSKIEKLPSGSYRVRKMYKGKKVSMTFDKKPTESDIMVAFSEKINTLLNVPESAYRLSFEDAIKKYVELKKDRISVKYQKEYLNLNNKFSEVFAKKDIFKMKQLDFDYEVAKWLEKKLSYKTMLNYYSMAKTVIGKFNPELKLNDNMLPEPPKQEEDYIPTKEDTKKILNWFRENCQQCYVAFWLSIFGLRRGEVFALTADDVDLDGACRITKDMVEGLEHKWVVKEPKTQASIRTINIDKELAQLIKIQGYVYKGGTTTTNKALQRACKELNIPKFNLHKMRHYCCTELYNMGFTEVDIMAYMGWEKESKVMKDVYRHSRLKKDKLKKIEIAGALMGPLKN